MKESLKHELGFQHLIQVKRPLIKLEEMKSSAKSRLPEKQIEVAVIEEEN